MLIACGKDPVPQPKPIANRDYKFSGGIISQAVLNSYLSRSISETEFLASPDFYNDATPNNPEDDERMLLNIGAKFIGRSIYSWGHEEYFANSQWLSYVKSKIDRMHQSDSDMIFQAAIFEIVTTKVNMLPIPDWVFIAFNQPVQTRNFNLTNMQYSDGRFVGQWGAGSIVPDISKLETRMFFYFMAVQYMNAGIEAIHFGQVLLMGQVDATQNYAGWSDILSKVRTAAKTKARRGTVLCDGHCPNIADNGNLLLDFCSYPLRVRAIIGDPQKGEIKKFYLDAIYGTTLGGKTPSGWSCTNSPYIVEFDNFGISDHPGVASLSESWVWGYDEISWYYLQPTDYKNLFLAQIEDYISKVDPVGFIEMPGSRVVTIQNSYNPLRYRCNTKSVTCPDGQSQELTIKQIWSN